METFDHKKIDKKWQDTWEKDGLYKAPQHPKKKQYILDMFPYPSGAGLHVGHPEGYTATDILSRFLRMNGHDVLHPMGWDAFGLPAENYAIKQGVKPAQSTAQNIERFREQIKSIGLSYDWSREINTSDPEYYKWTQWLFLQFYKKGLAYKKEAYVNWCPKDQTVLANEQVVNGACERCGTKVIQKSLSQWFFKITDYADRLLNDLDKLDWPEPIKLMQKNWIGRSEGAEIDFEIETHPPTPSQREGESIKRFVILHGKGSTPNDNYYPWLKKELENRGFEVQVPQMPNASEPNDDEQTDFVQKNCVLDEKTVIVGHSFGGIVALRLAEHMKLGGIVLVATPFTGDFLDKKERPTVKAACEKGFDFKKIKENAGYIEVLGDTKDHIVSMTDGEAFADKFGASLIRVEAQKSHFGGKQESAILTAVLTHPPTPSQREGEFGYHTTDPKTWAVLQERVLEMRKNPTEAEEKLWQSLRKNLTGYHFRRQHIIGRFIVDFVCLEKSLVIEVDGDIHDFQKKEDEERTEFLKEKGFRVIRFRNEKVIKNLDEVVKNITKDLDSRENTPPLWGGAGGGVIKVFTTRPDTLFGATYMVLAPEHALVEQITTTEQKNYVINYVIKTKEKTEIQRTSLEKEKTGVFTGAYAINPATKEKIPVWIADYVLMNYGTGAIMAVPAHDERDKAFAEKYKLPIKTVVDEDGKLFDSNDYTGLDWQDAKKKITKDFGSAKVQYKLRDWLVSRQRYWGAPIPIIYCDPPAGGCGMQAVPEEDLPVKLPTDVDFLPTGESPIARSKTFHKVKCPNCGEPAKRDSDTMDTFVDSSWYFFRFTDPHNDKVFADKKKMKEWLPVDTYVGGAEHAVLHLLYARFFTKALTDLGYIDFEEPFVKLRNQGLILGPDGEKMSKSRGNVINPDDVIAQFGADAFRMYEMFMGPLEEVKPWQTNGIVGVKRFLDKVWRTESKGEIKSSAIHKLIKKVTSDIENFKFNTAIAAFMEFLNENKELSQKDWETFLILLAPFAPHITEELWHQLGHKDSIHQQAWPKFDVMLVKEAMVTVVVQVSGKRRSTLEMEVGVSQETISEIAKADANVKKHLEGKEIMKEIFVQDKLINFVVK